MKIKLFFAFVVVLFTAVFASCSDDKDERIYFTQDEIVGDINTGNKINIGNSLSIYAGYGTSVKVHGQSGNIKATTSDASIATVEAVNSGGYNDGHLLIVITGVGEGQATIFVTDDAGKTAELTVDVMNPVCRKYVRTDINKDKIYVFGVTDSEVATIQKEINKSLANEESYELEYMPNNPESSRWILHVYGVAGQLLYDMYGKQPAGISFEFYKSGDENTFGIYTFGEDNKVVPLGEDNMVINLSPMYKSKYPNAEVYVLLKAKRVDLSSSKQYTVNDVEWYDDCPYDIYKIYPHKGTEITENVELFSGIATEYYSVWLFRNTFSPSDKYYNNTMYMATSALVLDSISENPAYRIPNLRRIGVSKATPESVSSLSIADILTHAELDYMCKEAPVGTKITFGLYLLNADQKALQKLDVTFVKKK